MAHENEVDEISGTETTGHSWDGIKELNTPLPRWWLYTFYICIVWGLAYTVFYPAWPMLTTNTKGILGWSSRADAAAEMKTADATRAQAASVLENADMPTILASEEMRTVGEAGGRSLFKVYCVQCHGSGAAGAPGYPNLNDDDWIWGGDGEAIYQTLKHGIRHPGDDDTRLSEMPAFGRDGILEAAQISDVAWFVRKLSGQEHEAEAAARGQTVFVENCAACHGENGEGVRELGGPRLSDAIWIYGGEHSQIVSQLNAPKQGVMPAWGVRLGETAIKQLAVYVHGLGGGE